MGGDQTDEQKTTALDGGRVIEPYYDADGITIYHADCRDVLPQLGPVDLVLTDPPYGLGDRWTGGTWFQRGVYQGSVPWDYKAATDAVSRVMSFNRTTILWGGNYYSVPASRCWLVWRKTNSVPTMADCELAWTNLDRPAAVFESPCNGWPRRHPTEKPLDLMSWCLGFSDAHTILDPFMGSGTTLVAAKQLGRRAIGIEIEKKYCDIAVERLKQGVLPLVTKDGDQ